MLQKHSRLHFGAGYLIMLIFFGAFGCSGQSSNEASLENCKKWMVPTY